MEDVETRIFCTQVSVELDQRVKIAILAHLGEIGILLVCQRTLHLRRRRRADHDHRAGVELEAPSRVPFLGMEQS
jgi:hypothetical protein